MQSSSIGSNALIIKDIPVLMWFIAMVFWFLGGLFVYDFTVDSLTPNKTASTNDIIIVVLGGFGSLVAGIFTVFRSPITKITVNRRLPDVEVVKYAAAGKTVTKYAKSNIKHFCVIEEETTDGMFYYFGLETTGGKPVKLTVSPQTQTRQNNLVARTNQFLGKARLHSAPVITI
jgi:hypothetical protein